MQDFDVETAAATTDDDEEEDEEEDNEDDEDGDEIEVVHFLCNNMVPLERKNWEHLYSQNFK